MKTLMMKLKVLAAVVAAVVASGAQAELVWTTGKYDPATWQPDPGNVFPVHCPSSSGHGTAQSAYVYTDGSVSSYSQTGNGFTWEWPLDMPIDVTALHIFSRWGDSGRDGIHIKDVLVRYEGGDGYASLGCGACDYDANQVTQFAFLADSAGAVIAEKVVAIKVVGGTQDNGGTGYAEVELVGTESYSGLPQWSYATYTAASWSAAEENVLGSALLTSSSGLSGNASELNNGKLTGGANVNTGATLCWQLAEATDIGELRFYSYWSDSGRDGIAIDDILVKTSSDGEWVTISERFPKFAVGVNPSGFGSTGRIFASVKGCDGAALYPEPVTDVKIVFGVQDNGYTNYDEIEVLQWINHETVPSEMGEVSASVDRTTIRWRGALAKVGSGESTELTLYVSTDGQNFTAEKVWTVTDTEVRTYEKDFEQELLTVYWYFECVNENQGQQWSDCSSVESIQTLRAIAPVGEITSTVFVNTNLFTASLTLTSLGSGASRAAIDAAVYADAALTELVAEQCVASAATDVSEPFVATFNGLRPNTDYYLVFMVENDVEGEMIRTQKVCFTVPSHIDGSFSWTGQGDGVSFDDCYNWGCCNRVPGAGNAIVISANSIADIDLNGRGVGLSSLTIQNGAELTLRNASAFTVQAFVVGSSITMTLDNAFFEQTDRNFLHDCQINTGNTFILLNGSTLKSGAATGGGGYFGLTSGATLIMDRSSLKTGCQFRLSWNGSMTKVVLTDSEIDAPIGDGGVWENVSGPVYFTNTTFVVGKDVTKGATVVMNNGEAVLSGSTTFDFKTNKSLSITSTALTLAGSGATEPTVILENGNLSLNPGKLTLDLTGMGTARHTRTKDCDWTLFKTSGALTFPAEWTNGVNLAKVIENSNGKVEAVNAPDELKRYQLLCVEKDGGVKALVLRYNKPKIFAVILR